MNFEISLNNLTFYAYHGVFEEERKTGNRFRLSLSVYIPYNDGIDSDTLESTVSYADLYDIINREMQVPRNLLEKLALDIIKRIREQYPQITGGKITIEKVHPPIPGMLGTASITLTF